MLNLSLPLHNIDCVALNVSLAMRCIMLCPPSPPCRSEKAQHFQMCVRRWKGRETKPPRLFGMQETRVLSLAQSNRTPLKALYANAIKMVVTSV